MKEEWKVYIKGVPNRGDEVIKILEDLGAKNSNEYKCCYADYLYYIGHDGNIHLEYEEREEAKIIMDNYRKINLSEKWKDGDLLVCHMLSGNRYAVYSDDSELMTFNAIITYVDVDNHTYGINGLFDKEDFKLASNEEYKEFYDLLHKHGKDWDSEKKQLVDLKWKPKDGEDYWTVIVGIENKLKLTWFGTKADEARYKLCNCFKTREEAEVMAEKVKNLFLQNYEKTKENS